MWMLWMLCLFLWPVGAAFWFCTSCSVCFAVWKNRHMRTVTNYFIVNLSFADVLVTIICLPASLVVDITETWFFGNTLCKIVPYLQVGHHFCHRTPWPDLLYVLIHPSSFIISQFLNHQEGMRTYLDYNEIYFNAPYVRSVTMVFLSLVHVLCLFQSCPPLRSTTCLNCAAHHREPLRSSLHRSLILLHICAG